MSTLTDQFDLVLQVNESTIDRLLKSQHCAGVMGHFHVRIHGGKRISLQVGRPRLTLLTELQPDQRARAELMLRIHANSRSESNNAEKGSGAVADVSIRAVISFLDDADPVVLGTETSVLLVDWSETREEDITVYGADHETRQEIKCALFGFISDVGPVRVGIPAVSLSSGTIGSGSFRFLEDSSGGSPVVTIGLNVGSQVKGARAGLQQAVVQNDWALALSSQFVLNSIKAAMRQQLGDRLPPPHGSGPVVISEEMVCLLETPVGCASSAMQSVFLDSFDVQLQTGAIVFAGSLRQTTDSIFVPDVTASFEASATVTVGQNQTLEIDLADPAIELQEWYAQIADFFSGASIQETVRDGVRDAISSAAAGNELTSIFSSALLREISRLGINVDIEMTSEAVAIEIREDAIVVHGQLLTPSSCASPSAGFAVLAGEESSTHMIFDGASSWAPGGNIIQYHWDFGDGATEATSGTQLRIAADHHYTSGVYSACLTVMDDRGITDTFCQTVRPGILVVRRVSNSRDIRNGREWDVCEEDEPYRVKLQVFRYTSPAKGVDVTITCAGRTLEEKTGGAGLVSFELTETDFIRIASSVDNDSVERPFNLTERRDLLISNPRLSGNRGVVVQAQWGELRSNRHILWLVDCASRVEIVNLAEKMSNDLRNRLRGLSTAVPGETKPSGPRPDPVHANPIDASLAQTFADVQTTLIAVESLTRSMAIGSSQKLAAELWGLDAGKALLPQIRERLAKTYETLNLMFEGIEDEFNRSGGCAPQKNQPETDNKRHLSSSPRRIR